MEKITIFSTKTINGDNCLFNKEVCLTQHTEHLDFLRDFFINMEDLVTGILKNENQREQLKKILNEWFDKKVAEQQFDETQYATQSDMDTYKLNEDLANIVGEKADSLDQIIKQRINEEINEQASNLVLERVYKWNLKNELFNCAKESTALSDVNNKYNMWQLDGRNVYAIRCLEGRDKDISWVSCMIKCAKSLVGDSENAEINLVLHDKDLGDNTYYASRDMTVIDDNVVRQLFDSQNTYLQTGDICRIIFFKHTSNDITEILNKSFYPERDIHEEVKKAFNKHLESDGIKSGIIDNHTRMNEIKEESSKCLEMVDGIEKAIQLNEELNSIIDTL